VLRLVGVRGVVFKAFWDVRVDEVGGVEVLEFGLSMGCFSLLARLLALFDSDAAIWTLGNIFCK